jgi:uncharacterized membrane protein YhaH (DUF805 family)
MSFGSLFSSSGRCNRKSYWAVEGLGFAIILVGAIIVGALGGENPLILATTPFMIAVIVMLINNQIKRLHDLGRSGWWLLAIGALNVIVGLVCFFLVKADASTSAGASGIGNLFGILLVIVLGSLPGQPVENRFGPPTRLAQKPGELAA